MKHFSRILSSSYRNPAIHPQLPLRHQKYTTMTAPIVNHATPIDALEYHPTSTKPEITPKVQSLALPESEDDPDVRRRYRPFITGEHPTKDWVDALELQAVLNMAENDLQNTISRLKVLVLYGSLRKRSYSRLVAFEASRILFRLGCDVRVFDPEGLPVKNDTEHNHPKAQELRDLSNWSDGHIWVSPEQHGNLTAAFKNQIDWIPLSTGSVRPAQGRTLAIAQVCGGSQSFNAMRMFTIPNQSSIPKAYTHFLGEDHLEGSRLLPSSNRDRLVDCMEEFVKYTILMRPHLDLFGDRFSEREERRKKEGEWS
ncbi:arsenic resistance protein ArsH [Aspergillus ellipticus CBS 707.79]|uniref:Arsenic resistance protein ArsH n=1 Tax=Aspergillus ellipticus CBS 707.79 TaxID=1448320 RepID=A0A319CT64_9EURO|nr:arsenic resistance protein ArsH [Aspergillus ellipticus CBS 707.79]